MKNPLRWGDLPYVLVAPWLLSKVFWLVEQRVTTTDAWEARVAAWPEWPGWMFAGMALAVVFMEPFRPSSRAVWLWRRWNRMLAKTECWYDQPTDQPIRREVYARLTFSRDVTRLEIRVWGFHGPNSRHLIEVRPSVRAVKGDGLRLAIATVPIFPEHFFGPRFGRVSSSVTIGETEPKLVLIELRGGLRRQTVKVQLSVFSPSQQWQLFPFTEDHDPFQWPEKSVP